MYISSRTYQEFHVTLFSVDPSNKLLIILFTWIWCLFCAFQRHIPQCDSNRRLCHQKYSLPSTIVLGFVACRVTSKITGIGYAEHSWGDVKTIKSGKISALHSDIYDNHSIVYKSDCVEEASNGRTLSHTDSKYGSHSHSWNDEDHTFDYQLDQWYFQRLFQNSDEAITRELKLYIEDLEKSNIKNKSQW